MKHFGCPEVDCKSEGPGKWPHQVKVFNYTEVLCEHNEHEKPHLTFPPGVGGEVVAANQRMMQDPHSKFPLLYEKTKCKTMATATFTAKDMHPYSVIENKGFRATHDAAHNEGQIAFLLRQLYQYYIAQAS